MADDAQNAHDPKWEPPQSHRFLGDTFDAERDGSRLTGQLRSIYDVMRDCCPRTLRQLAAAADCPEASASARFRDLKRLGFPMSKENLGAGTWLYWMEPPVTNTHKSTTEGHHDEDGVCEGSTAVLHQPDRAA